ncbi:MAG TPA: hypothetical protein VFL15_02575 [Gammaproteobacteria bacterium]|nr:hypothetical protein [Gammaproteobacteria bacterium]
MRIFMGIVWFIAFYIVLTIVYMIVMGVVISSGHPVAGYAEGVKAGIEFAQAHQTVLSLCRWAIFILSVVFAVVGTWKGVLPGTRKKSVAPAAD